MYQDNPDQHAFRESVGEADDTEDIEEKCRDPETKGNAPGTRIGECHDNAMSWNLTETFALFIILGMEDSQLGLRYILTWWHRPCCYNQLSNQPDRGDQSAYQYHCLQIKSIKFALYE